MDFDVINFAKVNSSLQRIPAASQRILLGGNLAGIDGIACVDGFDKDSVDTCGSKILEYLGETFRGAGVDNGFTVEPDGADFALRMIIAGELGWRCWLRNNGSCWVFRRGDAAGKR